MNSNTDSEKQAWNQKIIMDLMIKFGYVEKSDGLCFGISYMAMQAHLSQTFATFINRLYTVKEFAEYLEKQDPIPTDLNESLKNFTKDSSDIQAFFDCIILIQASTLPRFTALFEEGMQPTTQSSITNVIPLVESDAMKLYGGIKHYNSISFIKSKKELTAFFTEFHDYFKLKKNSTKNKKISLFIRTVKHQITLNYNRNTGIFYLVDPNVLPALEITKNNIHKIADSIFEFQNDFAVCEEGGVEKVPCYIEVCAAKDPMVANFTKKLERFLKRHKQPQILANEISPKANHEYKISPLKLALTNGDQNSLKRYDPEQYINKYSFETMINAEDRDMLEFLLEQKLKLPNINLLDLLPENISYDNDKLNMVVETLIKYSDKVNIIDALITVILVSNSKLTDTNLNAIVHLITNATAFRDPSNTITVIRNITKQKIQNIDNQKLYSKGKELIKKLYDNTNNLDNNTQDFYLECLKNSEVTIEDLELIKTLNVTNNPSIVSVVIKFLETTTIKIEDSNSFYTSYIKLPAAARNKVSIYEACKKYAQKTGDTSLVILFLKEQENINILIDNKRTCFTENDNLNFDKVTCDDIKAIYNHIKTAHNKNSDEQDTGLFNSFYELAMTKLENNVADSGEIYFEILSKLPEAVIEKNATIYFEKIESNTQLCAQNLDMYIGCLSILFSHNKELGPEIQKKIISREIPLSMASFELYIATFTHPVNHQILDFYCTNKERIRHSAIYDSNIRMDLFIYEISKQNKFDKDKLNAIEKQFIQNILSLKNYIYQESLLPNASSELKEQVKKLIDEINYVKLNRNEFDSLKNSFYTDLSKFISKEKFPHNLNKYLNIISHSALPSICLRNLEEFKEQVLQLRGELEESLQLTEFKKRDDKAISKWNILLGLLTAGIATLVQFIYKNITKKDIWIKSHKRSTPEDKAYNDKIDEKTLEINAKITNIDNFIIRGQHNLFFNKVKQILNNSNSANLLHSSRV